MGIQAALELDPNRIIGSDVLGTYLIAEVAYPQLAGGYSFEIVITIQDDYFL